MNKKQLRVRAYLEANGDKTLRVNYDLNKDSVVFDIGGYEGQWSYDIFSKYGCNIHIFEPVPSFAENIKKIFSDNKKIQVYPFGLSDRNSNEKIYLNKNKSSLFKKEGNTTEIKLVKFSDFFLQNNIDFIDLMKINTEGGEYDLLEELIRTDLVKKLKNIQIQFHNFVPDAKERMEKIQSELEKTHRLTYQFKFVWENWILK
jgi:FkbM family methyltransferase